MTDPNLSPPINTGFTAFIKKVGETSFYRKAMAYRPAYLRGGLGIAVAILVYHHEHKDDPEGALIQGVIAWRLFVDNSMGQAKDDAKKIL